MGMRLKKNSARCILCNTTIESRFTHDFVACSCGSIFTDGGTDYVRRGGDPNLFEDLCEWEEVPGE
jgi:hypothetical protein